jgi:hypothetical protein
MSDEQLATIMTLYEKNSEKIKEFALQKWESQDKRSEAFEQQFAEILTIDHEQKIPLFNNNVAENWDDDKEQLVEEFHTFNDLEKKVALIMFKFDLDLHQACLLESDDLDELKQKKHIYNIFSNL